MEFSDESIKQTNINIGRQLLRARINAGMSQKEVTAAAGFSVSLLNKYETGENAPGLPNLILLCNILKVPVDQIVQDCHPDFIINAIDYYLSHLDQQRSVEILTEVRCLIDGK